VSPFTITPLPALVGQRVLVVEDEPFFALRLAAILEKLGCTVLGPAHRLAEGLAWAGEPIDAAVLDINLGRVDVFPLADALAARAIPFVFVTAYERTALPRAHSTAPLITKPLNGPELARVLAGLLPRDVRAGSASSGSTEARQFECSA
jgi:CheY-like chemotaxis protein